MFFKAIKTFLNEQLRGIGSSRSRKARYATLLIGLTFITEAQASRKSINEDELFYTLHPRLQRPYQETQQEIEIRQAAALKEQEFENAFNVIDGVIAMYYEDVNFDNDIMRYTVEIGGVIPDVNASYTHATRTFKFPHVQQHEWAEIIRTAMDQGIVSHETGHMILHYLFKLDITAHTSALHEAFGDSTSHFYDYYNPATRQRFLRRLDRGQGCVGDTDFTCTRDSSQPLTLRQVKLNQEEQCKVHTLSRTFSSAIYRSMVDVFAKRHQNSIDEDVAGEIVKWHKRMLVDAILSLDYSNPTLMDVAGHMLYVSLSTPTYRDDLGNNFIKNGLIVILPRNLPSRHDPYPDSDYCPNEEFAMLCLTEQEYPETRGTFRKSWRN